MAQEQEDDVANDNRVRELLSNFYGSPSSSDSRPATMERLRRLDSLQQIDFAEFDPDHYMNSLLRKTPMDKVLQRYIGIAAEIKNLDSAMQMLVFENYNKFISATDTIRRMKWNIAGMESNIEQLLDSITGVRAKSDAVNDSMCERREHIEELNRTCRLLRKIQFVFDLPKRLRKCMKVEDYPVAVKHYLEALPILQDQVMDSSVVVTSRAQAVRLLQQLNHPVESLINMFLGAHWDRLLEDLGVSKPTMVNKLKSFLGLETGIATPDIKGETPTSPQKALEKIEEVHPLCQKLLDFCATFRYFASVQRSLRFETSALSATELIAALGVLSKGVTLLNELVPDAGLFEHASKAVEDSIRQHINIMFNGLYQNIAAALVIPEQLDMEASKQSNALRSYLEKAQRTIIQGSLHVLQDLKELLDKSEEYLAEWRDEYVDLVQAGFQDLFTNLVDDFLSLGVKAGINSRSIPMRKPQSGPLATPSSVLVLALLSVYIYQAAVPKITEIVGAWFIGGGAMSSEARPAFVPSEICRFFHATGDTLLHQVATLEAELHQLLDPGHPRINPGTKHSDHAGPSQVASKGDIYRVSQSKSKLWERDIAKLFTRRIELFTKVEYTQASVVSAVVKLVLKTFQEFVRLETLNCCGYQQIQLDVHYLRNALQNLINNDPVVDALFDEVCAAASDRCNVEPVPLDIAAMNRLVQAKTERQRLGTLQQISQA
ncbi:unnamed protein product [Sphagnum troendelagicum]|uniref:Vacuolar protein sorting-associated protein 51 homolog n=1 Tax=Sphagnum troendelagicum TaxID=128251 RepID=A0ABP0TQD7_9BRYO